MYALALPETIHSFSTLDFSTFTPKSALFPITMIGISLVKSPVVFTKVCFQFSRFSYDSMLYTSKTKTQQSEPL